MSPFVPRRSHLVERAAEAARAAIAADALQARAPRPHLAQVETTFPPTEPVVSRLSPGRPETMPPAVETVVLPTQQSQTANHLRRNDPAPTGISLLRQAGLVNPTDPVWEEIALVREQVLRSIETTPPAEGRQPRLVVVTSGRGGEGKSFVTLNLAASIAECTHRPVIMVDAERSAGSLTNLLDLGQEPGLAQLRKSDNSDPAGLLRRTEIPNLLILPHGTAPPSGAQHSAMTEALLHLAERLSDHIILVDTPACLESSIAGVLATAAGQIALVVEAERTKRAEVEAALDILDACPTLQLLLNRSALRVSDRFRARTSDVGDVAASAHQA
jgi:protein-tyrosine kinase